MPTICEVEFRNSNGNVVCAGQELCGIVRLALTEETHLRGIYVQICGKGSCQWVEGRTAFNGQADFLNETIYLIGGPNDSVHIDPNSYTYNFRCRLPPQLPRSFEGEFGHIRYSVRVVLASFSIFPDQKFKQPFRVVRQSNLNDNPALRQPILANAMNKFRYSDYLCICRLIMRQPKIVVKIPKSGYAPQEIIKVQIHVDDQKGGANCEFSVKLVKQTHYYAQTPAKRKRTEKQTVVKKMVCVRAQNVQEIVNVDMEVPALPPTDFSSNNIINTTYLVRVTASSGICGRILFVNVPITIGTDPILIVESVTPNTNLENSEFGTERNSVQTSNDVQTFPMQTINREECVSDS